MPSPIIDDGLTLEGLVPALAGLYDAVPFLYRPALPEEVVAFLRSRDKGTPRQETRTTAEFLTKHVPSWDVTDSRGAAVAVSAEVLERTYPTVLAAMVNHVLGYTSPQTRDQQVKNS